MAKLAFGYVDDANALVEDLRPVANENRVRSRLLNRIQDLPGAPLVPWVWWVDHGTRNCVRGIV